MRSPLPARTLLVLCALLSAGSIGAGAASAQELPNVFFDCDGWRCNRQYYRTEITWVNWVNDREVADVHVIMTSQGAGGGREYVLDFLGTDEDEPYERRYTHRSVPTDTEVEVLDGITHALSLGLAVFANSVGYRGLVSVEGPDPDESPGTDLIVSADEVDDPWNLWVFNLNGEAEVSGESSYSNTRINGTISAGRVTPDTRISFWTSIRHNRLSVELTDSTFVDTRTDWDANTALVYPIAAHWSFGFQGQVGRAVRFNQNFRAEATAAVEYSVFPYLEATRRALTLYYRIGPAFRDYIERTRYDETEEVRWEHTLQLRFSQRQPWGNASVSATGSHFLHDVNRHMISLDGELDFRIVRGLSFEVAGEVAWVDDQLYLSAGGVTDAEALLRLQQRASSFDYEFGAGFRVQFGSIFNNAVNNRIGRRW